MTPIPLDILKTWAGKKIHVMGYNPACVWKVVSVDEITGHGPPRWFVNCVTPSTNRPFRALAAKACYILRDDPTRMNEHA